MNMLFLYGPPAAGKLTIASEVAKLIGYPVFHNHLTRDLVQSIYPNHVIEHYALLKTLREDVMKYCTLNGTSLIFTMVYDGPADDTLVRDNVASVTKNGGQVLFVELTAPHEVFIERVSNESRKKHKKIVDTAQLSDMLQTHAYSSVPYPNVLKIDTSKAKPAQIARHIISHYHLTPTLGEVSR